MYSVNDKMPPEGLEVWVKYADGFEWVDHAELLADGKLHFSDNAVAWCYKEDLKYIPVHYFYWDGTDEDIADMRDELANEGEENE